MHPAKDISDHLLSRHQILDPRNLRSQCKGTRMVRARHRGGNGGSATSKAKRATFAGRTTGSVSVNWRGACNSIDSPASTQSQRTTSKGRALPLAFFRSSSTSESAESSAVWEHAAANPRKRFAPQCPSGHTWMRGAFTARDDEVATWGNKCPVCVCVCAGVWCEC